MAFGPMEWAIVAGLFVLLFGAAAIPKLARSLGQAKGEFSRAKQEFDAEMARAERGEHTRASEAQIRATAREMGIEEEGRPLDEVKRQLAKKLD